jgi:hypothetical protein
MPYPRNLRATGSSIVACGAVVAVAAVAACGGDRRARPDTAASVATAPVPDVPPPPTDTLHTIPRPVIVFLSFVQTQRAAAGDSSARPSDLAVEGLSRLAVALASLAARDTAGAAELRPRVDLLQARVDSLAQLSDTAGRVQRVRDAFSIASEVLESLQSRVPPALTDRVAEVRQAAAAIRPDQSPDAQREAVLRALDRTAAAVRGLTGAPPP